MKYTIIRAADLLDVAAKWNDPAWSGVRPITIGNHMGEKPKHFPRVMVKLVYDVDSVFVIFHVEDQYVLATAEKHQDAVCIDSCVEFFFTPGEDVSVGYFNLEMNCGGTMLMHFQRIPRKDSRPLNLADIRQIELRHELPRIVEPEISEPTTWTVAYRIPFAIVEKYFPGKFQKPAAGVKWRANFYKCADKSSHPHWLTWAPVGQEQPDFHRPKDFGVLEFG